MVIRSYPHSAFDTRDHILSCHSSSSSHNGALKDGLFARQRKWTPNGPNSVETEETGPDYYQSNFRRVKERYASQEARGLRYISQTQSGCFHARRGVKAQSKDEPKL